jgi:hypothetical protein
LCGKGIAHLESDYRNRENELSPPRSRVAWLRFAAHGFAGVAALFLIGCTAAHYRRAADREVYGIVALAEREIFGSTNSFRIDTPYSTRAPREILPEELINDRQRKGVRKMTLEDALEIAAS